MTWRGPRTSSNPIYSTRSWRNIRKHWQQLGLPCARCGYKIDYLGPKYLLINGKRKQNPYSLAVGHIVSVRKATILGWTEAQTNALSNTQPEHLACSNSSGAREGQRAQRAKQRVMATRINTSRRW
jgi:hypothetical protein